MEKEPWIYKDSKYLTLAEFNKAFDESLPKMREDFEKLMDKDSPAAKLFK